jgi:hypothetical protein
MLQQADQTPGREARGRAVALRRELDGILERLEAALGETGPM